MVVSPVVQVAVAMGGFSDGDEANDGRNAACHGVCAHVVVFVV